MPSRRAVLSSLGVAGATAVGGPVGAAAGRARAAQPRAPETVWTRRYDESPAFAIVDDVVPVGDGYVLAGTTREPSRGLVAGTGRAGRPRCHRVLGDARSTLSAAAPHPDGGVVAAGTRNVGDREPWSDDSPSADPWLVRLDADGRTDWARTLQPSAVRSSGRARWRPAADWSATTDPRRAGRSPPGIVPG